MKKNMDIPAIHDKALRKILEKYGLAAKIDNNELICSMCDNLITWENIAAVKVNGNNLEVFCDDPDCIDNASNI